MAKRISVNAFENVMKNTYTPDTTLEWNGVEVTVTRTLSFKSMMEFVHIVADSCFTKDTNAYLPEVKDFITKVCILEKYANFTMPRNVELQYALIYQTDAVECVMEHINKTQFYEIREAIDRKIDLMVRANIEAVNKQINDVCSSLDNIYEQFEKLFDGVDNTDMKNVIKTISENGLSEEKLVEAFSKYAKLKEDEQ